MRRLLALATLTSTLACTRANSNDDTGKVGGADGGDTDGGGGPSADAPTIASLDAWCYQHTTGEEANFWVASVNADDPQGAHTIESFFEGITVLSDADEPVRYSLACNADGECSSSWNESDGILCEEASSYTIQAAIVDEDGNWSAPESVPGKQCATSSGC